MDSFVVAVLIIDKLPERIGVPDAGIVNVNCALKRRSREEILIEW
jgi:hypothetical protein